MRWGCLGCIRLGGVDAVIHVLKSGQFGSVDVFSIGAYVGVDGGWI